MGDSSVGAPNRRGMAPPLDRLRTPASPRERHPSPRPGRATSGARAEEELWLDCPMANGDYRVAFVDLAGTLIYKTVTAQVPCVGDHIDLPTQRVAGVV